MEMTDSALDDERSHDLADRCGAEFAQGGRQGIEHLDRNRGVVKVRGADLNGRGPRDEEIHDVVDRGDAADADDRYPHRLGRLKDRPQGDRLDGGAAQSAHHPPQLRAPPPPVDGHAQAGVDQGDGVAASGLGRAGNAGDIGHVGRQLGDHRHAARFADAGHHGLAHRRIGAEIDSAADIGTGDIQFQGIHAGQAIEPGRHVDELLLALARDADDDLRAQPGQIGQQMGDERLDAVVIQADGIEHAAAGFVGPRRRIARGEDSA